MSTNGQIGELLEEILDTGRTPEEVCAACPELLSEVQERLRKLRSVEAQLDDLFPPSGARTGSYEPPASTDGAHLPSIQGYETLSVLGRGGMGVVYRARHLKLNRVVAIKMLLAGSHAARHEHMRFLREAEAVAGLRHTNIVQVYDFGEADGQPYYSMEYIDGGSLAQKLAVTSLSVRDAAKIIATLAQAVSAAHQSGIIHRDLKPSNILLDDIGTPKISDFGLARRLDSDDGLTLTGARLGTPNYMAPEQMMKGATAVGPAADIFALGTILYELLSGHPPFRGENLSETERRLTTEEPAPLSRKNAKVPRDLETICLKCLEKDPDNRYATAGDLADDLDRFLKHEPIHARPVSPAERSMRWVRRNPLPTALATTAMVLVAFILGDAIQQWTLAAQRSTEKSRLTERFESGVQLVQDGRFAEAHAILGKLGDGGNKDLRQRIDRTLSDLESVEELNAITVKRALKMNESDTVRYHDADAAAEYAAIFERIGIKMFRDDSKVIASRISQSDIKGTLLGALDDWAICETDEGRRSSLLEIARRADPDPSGWRDRARYPATWRDRDALTRLADTAPVEETSVQLLRSLGDRLTTAGINATPFLKRVQREHADSFLANFSLAEALRDKDPAEAIRYYQAALAIRTQAAPAHNNLAVALAALGRTDEAIPQYEEALELAPQSELIHYNLGLALLVADRTDEAIDEFQQAIKLAPDLTLAHGALGEALLKARRYTEAEAALRRCVALLSKSDPERTRITETLRRCEELSAADK